MKCGQQLNRNKIKYKMIMKLKLNQLLKNVPN